MRREHLRMPLILSMLALLLIGIASFIGLAVDGVYRDNTWVSSQLRGADLVRLVAAVPLFAGAIWFTYRGSLRGLLVWLGFLWLAVYDYAFYLFAAAFNELFLIYVAIFVLSIAALIWSLPRLDVGRIRAAFSDRTPVRLVSGYMFFWVLMLGGLWIAQSIAFIATGNVPQSVIDSGHPTAIVFAIDLGILLPAVFLGAIWLWRRQPWGYVLAVMVNVKGATYALALISMGIFMERAGIESGGLVFLWAFFAVASILAALALLLNIPAGPRHIGGPEEASPTGRVVGGDHASRPIA